MKILIFDEFNHNASWSYPFVNLINYFIFYFKSYNIEIELSSKCKNYNINDIVFGISGITRQLTFHRFNKNKMIIYNSESLLINIKHRNRYLDFWKGKNLIQIWDYSRRNLSELTKLFPNIPNYFVPITYDSFFISPILIKNFNIDKPKDILFYGSLNERRNNIFNKLKEHFQISIKKFNNIKDLENSINEHKIILIIHFYENDKPIDTFRLFKLITNKIFVIQESPFDEEKLNFEKLIYSPYENIIDTCNHYLSKTQKERDEISNDIYNWWKKNHLFSNYIPKIEI